MEALIEDIDWVYDSIRLRQGSFTHSGQRYYISGTAPTQIRSNVNDLFNLVPEDVLGVIFAYRRRTLADSGADEGESDLGDEVLFSPMREPGNDLVTSALLDILHVSGTIILPVRERRSRRPRSQQTFRTIEDVLRDAGMDVPPPPVDTFHFVSYVFKNNKIYKLDGAEPFPLLVHTFSQNDNQDWCSWLADHLETKIENEDMESTCAVIMKKVDHRERIYTCNNEMEELENQLMGEITSEDAKVTLTAMTTLRKQAKQTFDKIVSDHGVLQEPRRFPSRGKVSDKSKKTERHVDFILPTPEPASSSSDSSTDDEDNPPALSTSDLIESGQLVIDPALLAQIDVEGLEVEEAPWSESSEVTLGAENPEAAEEGGDTQEEGAGDTEEEGEDTEPEDSEDTKEKDEDTEPEDSGEDSGDSEDTEDSGNTGDNEEEMSDSEPEDTGNTKEEGGDTNPEDSGEDSGNSEDTEDSGNAGGTEEMTNLKGTEEEMAEPKNTEGKVVEPVNTIDIAKAVIRTAIKRKNEDFENYKHLPPKKRYTRRQ